MTTASHRQNVDLTINIYKPDPSGYTTRDLFIRSLTAEINAYTQVIQAVGGYWSATFSINDRQDKIEDWIDQGLGRHIEVHDNALVKIWEGFVNKISATLGPLSVVRGPLLNIANRTSVIYSTVDTSSNPPVMGVRTRAATVNDTVSQGKFGILQSIMSAGGMTATAAEQARDTYLAENKEPETGQNVTIGRTSEPRVQIECLGYVHFFNKYIYNQTASSGTQNLSVQMTDVITADPNSLFDTGFADITENTLPVKRYENKDKKAWDLIKGLVALGDTSNNRYLFGVYNDVVPIYEAAPTTLFYQQRLGDPEQRVETLGGARVLPWNVVPGKFLLFSDFLVGRTEPTDLRLDPRIMFIESAAFRAPWGLILQGGKVDKLPQQLARLGLAGTGA